MDYKAWGPLEGLIGTWEGDKGDDRAPSDERSVERNLFRERMTLVAIGPVDNHEQVLFGLRYITEAFRLGEKDSFHQEHGYWLWDPAQRQVIRCFTIPRGVAVLAGGTTTADAKTFQVKAEVGSPTYGICSNLFLHEEFRTVRFTAKITVHGDGSFSYEQDSELQLKSQKEIFHHTDKNTLRRVDL